MTYRNLRNMICTNLKVKTGKDFVNFFYNVPEDVLPTKNEGRAVEKITIEVYVEDMMFFRKELRFCGADTSNHFGTVTIPQLGESEYSFRVRENMVSISKDRFVKESAGVNETAGIFIISDSVPAPAPAKSTGELRFCYAH